MTSSRREGVERGTGRGMEDGERRMESRESREIGEVRRGEGDEEAETVPL